jgi:hypothetical protein
MVASTRQRAECAIGDSKGRDRKRPVSLTNACITEFWAMSMSLICNSCSADSRVLTARPKKQKGWTCVHCGFGMGCADTSVCPGCRLNPRKRPTMSTKKSCSKATAWLGSWRQRPAWRPLELSMGMWRLRPLATPLMRRDCWLLTTCVRRCAMGRSLRWTQLGLNSGSARVSTCGPSAATTLSRKHGLAGLSLCFGECHTQRWLA